MDRNIQIFVYDKNHNRVNGGGIRFFAKGKLVGEAISADGRASVQVPSEYDDEIVSVEVDYRGNIKRAQLAKEQHTYDFEYEFAVGNTFLKDYAPAMVGLVLVFVGVGLSFAFRPIDTFEKQIVLIMLSVGAGGIASIIPGFLNFQLSLGQRLALSAAGALAVFAVIFFNPPAILQEETADTPNRAARQILARDPQYYERMKTLPVLAGKNICFTGWQTSGPFAGQPQTCQVDAQIVGACECVFAGTTVTGEVAIFH